MFTGVVVALVGGGNVAIEIIDKIDPVECFDTYRPPIPLTMFGGEGCQYDPTVKAPVFKEVDTSETV